MATEPEVEHKSFAGLGMTCAVCGQMWPCPTITGRPSPLDWRADHIASGDAALALATRDAEVPVLVEQVKAWALIAAAHYAAAQVRP